MFRALRSRLVAHNEEFCVLAEGGDTYTTLFCIAFVGTPEGCTQEAKVTLMFLQESGVTETNFLWKN